MSLKQRILESAHKAILNKNAFNLYELNRSVIREQNGFQFVLDYYDEKLLSSISKPPQKYLKDPLLPPFEPNLHVCDLKDKANHHVIVNKFMQCPGHIVLSCIDKNAEQGTKLNSYDFNAFSIIMKAFNNIGVAFYNSGLQSGCSQLHKHMQFAPIHKNPIFHVMKDGGDLPFIYHTTKLISNEASAIEDGYNKLLEKSKKDPPFEDYNFVMSDGHIAIIPRLAARHSCGVVINSLGVCGHIGVWKWSPKEIFDKPLDVITNLCLQKQ